MTPAEIKAKAKAIAKAIAAQDDFSSALRRTHAADERIKAAEALVRLVSMPDGGVTLVNALRSMRDGMVIADDLYTSLARRGMAFRHSLRALRSVTRLGWNVINMYDEITRLAEKI